MENEKKPLNDYERKEKKVIYLAALTGVSLALLTIGIVYYMILTNIIKFKYFIYYIGFLAILLIIPIVLMFSDKKTLKSIFSIIFILSFFCTFMVLFFAFFIGCWGIIIFGSLGR